MLRSTLTQLGTYNDSVGALVVGDGDGAVVVGDGDGADVVGALVVGDGEGAVVVGDGDGADMVGDGDGADVVGDGDGLLVTGPVTSGVLVHIMLVLKEQPVPLVQSFSYSLFEQRRAFVMPQNATALS